MAFICAKELNKIKKKKNGGSVVCSGFPQRTLGTLKKKNFNAYSKFRLVLWNIKQMK